MTIKAIYFNNVGKSGENPQFIYIDTDQTLAKVMTPGFLNKAVAEGEPISDKQMALVSIKTSPSSRVNQTKLFNVVNSNGVWSLVAPPGGIKFFAQQTTPGGSATESFAIPGLLTTDLAFTQIVAPGTNNVTILSATCFAGFLQINFSANPSNNCIFNYQILRSAS